MQEVTEEIETRKWYASFLEGNQKAFDKIVLRYKDRLILFIKTYVGRWEIAEELSQDVFVYLLLHKEKYDMAYSFKSYLYLIAKCRALNYLQKEKRVVIDEKEVPEDLSESLEETILCKEKLEEYIKAMEKIKQQHARILYLLNIEGLSYKEVARILNKTVAQVKSLAHRARQSLEKQRRKGEC